MELELYELCQVVAVGVGEQEEDQGEGVEHEDLVLEKPLEGVPDQLEAWRQLAFFCDVGRQSGGDCVFRSNWFCFSVYYLSTPSIMDHHIVYLGM